MKTRRSHRTKDEINHKEQKESSKESENYSDKNSKDREGKQSKHRVEMTRKRGESQEDFNLKRKVKEIHGIYGCPV